MKPNIFSKVALVGLVAISLTTHVYAQQSRMKMATEIPPGIETPDKLETSIGTLTSVDGVPDASTTQKVYDQLDLNRATEAFLNCIPIASMYGLKHGILKHGPANTTAVLFEDLMDSKAFWLTPNTTSIYMTSWLELGDEPMVIETPPNVLGFLNDAWFNMSWISAMPDRTRARAASF